MGAYHDSILRLKTNEEDIERYGWRQTLDKAAALGLQADQKIDELRRRIVKLEQEIIEMQRATMEDPARKD